MSCKTKKEEERIEDLSMLGVISHIWCHLREHAEGACTYPATGILEKQVFR